MGVSCLSSCSTNENAQAPDPSRWKLLVKKQYAYGYVLMVKYQGCTNFEGKKVMVYRGQFTERTVLDPHFADGDESPLVRLKPDDYGWELANIIAKSLTPMPPIAYGKMIKIPASLLTKKEH